MFNVQCSMSNFQVTGFPALQASILHSRFFGDAVTEKSKPGPNPAMCRTFREGVPHLRRSFLS